MDVEKFINDNSISVQPMQIGDFWFYCDDKNNLYISNGDSLNSSSSYLLAIPHNYTGDSLLTFSTGGNIYSYGETYHNGNYGYTENWHPINDTVLIQQDMVNYLMENNNNTIVAVTQSPYTGCYIPLVDAINYIRSDTGLNVDLNNLTFSGFSDGGLEATRLAATFSNNNSDNIYNGKIRIVYFDTNKFIDDFGNLTITDQEYDYLEQNIDNIDIVFYRPVKNQLVNLGKFIERKIPFTIIVAENGLNHHLYNFFGNNDSINLLTNNLKISDLNNFRAGNSGSNPYASIHVYRYTYDENGEIQEDEVTIDDYIYKFISNINLTDRYKYFSNMDTYSFDDNNLVSSNLKYIVNNMNELRTQIKSTSFLNNTNLQQYNGGDSIINEINGCVSSYVDAVATLLDKVVKETDNVVGYGSKYYETDVSLSKIIE